MAETERWEIGLSVEVNLPKGMGMEEAYEKMGEFFGRAYEEADPENSLRGALSVNKARKLPPHA